MLKIKNKDKKLIAILEDEDTEPTFIKDKKEKKDKKEEEENENDD